MVRKRLDEDIIKEMKSQEVIDKLARTFSVFGDQTRIRIILALTKEELCVAELSILLGMSHSAISHQMRALKDLDLVRCRKEGRRAYYSLNDIHIENLFKEGLKHVLEKI
ncbi:MAG: metalloregulator ArsR/SmtB family transcription factor [Candidatus Omnitrophota bacterium]|nr:metalloregulator ArsR/SmtB family transcription factor [Candidatus Omnitrophota bacterium]